jgi:uncharacterized protein YbjT (DUF2867 family)
MSNARRVLVIGATGRVGRHVVAGLLEHGAAVQALVRHPLTAGLPGEVSIVQGELERPHTVGKAAEGADAAFLLWPSFSAAGASEVVTELARHVPHAVYLSAARLQHDQNGVMEGVWADVERAIERSGMAWTFIRAGGFAANTLGWASQIRAGDEISIPYPRAARSLVHERDIADVAVRGLMVPGHGNEAFAVTGPEVLTQLEQVRAIGEAIGRALRVREQPPDVARREFAAMAGDEYADHAIAHWATLVDAPERATDDVARLTGHPARTFAQWAREHVDDFAPLSSGQVAEKYAAAFRTGQIDRAMSLLSPAFVRVAPLETGGREVELRGTRAVLENAERQNAGVEINAVDVGDPLISGDRFAIRFEFDETDRASGRRQTTTKLSLYTVDAGRIVREEVFYLTPAHR